MYESADKMVSHPDHYQSNKGIEVIDVIEAFTDGLNGIEATDTANIIKYACRWKRKNGVQDVEKIIWYAQHLVDHLRAAESSKNAPHYKCKYCGDLFDMPNDSDEQKRIFALMMNHLSNSHGIFIGKDVKVADFIEMNYEKENI